MCAHFHLLVYPFLQVQLVLETSVHLIGAMAETTPAWFDDDTYTGRIDLDQVRWDTWLLGADVHQRSSCWTTGELISSTLSPVFSFVYMFSKFNVRGFPWNWCCWTVAIQILFVWGELLKRQLELDQVSWDTWLLEADLVWRQANWSQVHWAQCFHFWVMGINISKYSLNLLLDDFLGIDVAGLWQYKSSLSGEGF